MTNTQIATLLNTKIIPNYFGQGEDGSHNPITLAEDLRNVVEVGKALSDLSVADLENFKGDLVTGVLDTYTDSRLFKEADEASYGLAMSASEYGGAIQRVKMKLMSASDTNILALTDASNSGPDYTDGKFYGASYDAKLYTVVDSFKVKFSISNNELKKSFNDATGVQRMIAMIEASVENTIRLELNGMARAVLRKMILSASTGSRVIPLLTTYNTQRGLTSSDPGYVTLANWKDSTSFKVWVQTLVLELRKYMADYNEKYNDGSVPTFTPAEDSRAILLTEFAAELDVALGSVYHDELVRGLGDYRTINFWQNGTPSILPQIASGSLHDQVVETTSDTPGSETTTINHVVGLFYDRYSAFVSIELDKMTNKYVPEEDFTTYFKFYNRRYAIDPRNTNVILTLA